MLKKQLEDRLCQMKEIVWEIRRYAQTLDEVVWIMEKELKEASDEEYLKNFVVAETNYYRDLKKDTFRDITAKEKKVWQELIDVSSKRES